MGMPVAKSVDLTMQNAFLLPGLASGRDFAFKKISSGL
jgi:hypothetical protein